jgi:hypothetical protein
MTGLIMWSTPVGMVPIAVRTPPRVILDPVTAVALLTGGGLWLMPHPSPPARTVSAVLGRSLRSTPRRAHWLTPRPSDYTDATVSLLAQSSSLAN